VGGSGTSHGKLPNKLTKPHISQGKTKVVLYNVHETKKYQVQAIEGEEEVKRRRGRCAVT
jgi:hypothetical protein